MIDFLLRLSLLVVMPRCTTIYDYRTMFVPYIPPVNGSQTCSALDSSCHHNSHILRETRDIGIGPALPPCSVPVPVASPLLSPKNPPTMYTLTAVPTMASLVMQLLEPKRPS